jgi:EAL domain-containing protein (putative c-di-GMP-specific phosphodiesterase class I)
MIRGVGARVSIDDFGMGYSSLAALAEITADELKVDRSFITDIHQRPRSQAVLRTIESLAQSLGMTIVVEGVETFEELLYLRAATKINVAQGYYFGRPITFDAPIPVGDLVDEGRTFTEARQIPPSRGTQMQVRKNRA